MDRIKPGMVVETDAGASGVTVPDFMGCCAEWETPVVFEGRSLFEGVRTDTLKIIGPENPKPAPHKCGAGRGADCCIFLTCGAQGFECERHSYGRYQLIFRKDQMTSKRLPTEAYPQCQKFSASSDTSALRRDD